LLFLKDEKTWVFHQAVKTALAVFCSLCLPK